jgi:hypothetical protein
VDSNHRSSLCKSAAVAAGPRDRFVLRGWCFVFRVWLALGTWNLILNEFGGKELNLRLLVQSQAAYH